MTFVLDGEMVTAGGIEQMERRSRVPLKEVNFHSRECWRGIPKYRRRMIMATIMRPPCIHDCCNLHHARSMSASFSSSGQRPSVSLLRALQSSDFNRVVCLHPSRWVLTTVGRPCDGGEVRIKPPGFRLSSWA